MLYFQSKTLLSFKLEALYIHMFQYLGEKCLGKIPVSGAGAQQWTEGAAGVASKGKGQGLPRARHSPSQPQGTAEPFSHTHGTFWKEYSRKAQNSGKRVAERTKKECDKGQHPMRGKC